MNAPTSSDDVGPPSGHDGDPQERDRHEGPPERGGDPPCWAHLFEECDDEPHDTAPGESPE